MALTQEEQARLTEASQKYQDEQRLETETSSNIAWIAYRLSTGCLKIGFRNGTTYEYENVSKEAWDKFNMSESKGKHFNSVIRKQFVGKKL